MITSLQKRWLRAKIRRLRPIIIGGCARSGTSLLLSMLSAHPQVLAIPEETRLLCPGAYWPAAGGIAPPDLDQLHALIAQSGVPAGCSAWCEKTPRNVLNVESILENSGSRTRFVHLVRDGRDVILSRHPKEPNGLWVEPERWVNDVREGLRFREHPQVITIHYEDLVREPDHTLRALCDFVLLEYHEKLTDYPRHSKILECESWFTSARSLTDESIGRWKRPEHSERVEQLLAVPGAIELLEKTGYEL